MIKTQLAMENNLELEDLQNQIIKHVVEDTDRRLLEFFTPYFRQSGIKGEITKGKIKWRGIKMLVNNGLTETTYQLIQRGKPISPKYTINY